MNLLPLKAILTGAKDVSLLRPIGMIEWTTKKNQSEYNNTLAHFQMTAFDSCISKNMTFESRVSRLKMYTFGFECEHSLTE